jgi:hypothetical protein
VSQLRPLSPNDHTLIKSQVTFDRDLISIAYAL